MSVKIDYSRDELLDEFAIATLKDRYMIPGEQSPQEAFARAAETFADDEDHAQRLYDYVSQLWFMFATPVLSNGGTRRGLPISCFLNYVDDSREGITDHFTENAFLSSFGGGIGGTWSDVRSVGTKTSKGSESTGVMPFMKVVDAEMLAFSQGVTRRGSYASYLHVSHPEIEEFLDVRKPTGGDTNRKCLNLHHGVVISDSFMERIHNAGKINNFDDSWDLIDPHTQQVVKTVSARALWVKLLQNRMETGEPYIMFENAVQNELPDFQKRKGLKVHHSNLCSEITLATDEERTAVCCLSSVNLEYYDEWKNHPAFIPDLIRMLDNVLTNFIDNAPEQLERAKFSAMRERSIGLGAMGFHAYLQRNGIPFESAMAGGTNLEMFNYIKSKADQTTRELAIERGACPDDDTASVRNAHLLAIAPNASSSILCGNTSPSIEPFRANAFPVVKDLVVDRSSFDRIQHAGGYISVNTSGNTQDANAIPIPKDDADLAFDAATCIGCGACVASCKNSSAMLFVSAKVSQFALLPQGQVEAKDRVTNMVNKMDEEGFGNCTNTGACEVQCPKGISLDNISRMNREFLSANLKKS